MGSTVVAVALLAMVPPSWAADLLMPNPVLSPAEVVSIQLTALQANDTPETNAGIAQTWAFAQPVEPLPPNLDHLLLPQGSQFSRNDLRASTSASGASSAMWCPLSIPWPRRSGAQPRHTPSTSP
jgi:hypothetical protein